MIITIIVKSNLSKREFCKNDHLTDTQRLRTIIMKTQFCLHPWTKMRAGRECFYQNYAHFPKFF